MTSILKINKFNLAIIYLLVIFCFPVFAQAQTALSLSITPTLIDIESDPGDIWSSNIKVINNNQFPLVVYGSIANFEPTGEGGQGIFAPLDAAEGSNSTLGEWIELTEESVEIAPYSSAPINFVVTIPKEAQPGGHFAAILIGTQPQERDQNNSSMQTSQVVSSLFFLNVSGDVIEDGLVRSFEANNSFSSEPQSNFSLRFENRGNVHIQPQGDIVIYNMWGKERGRIPINYHTSFGNALPGTIRKYDFSWKGELSFTDIGLYKAEVDLAYGRQDRKFTNADVFFWVLPVKAFFITISSILGIVLFGMWVVRSYIRRVLSLAGVNPDRLQVHNIPTASRTNEPLDIRKISAPVRTGISDLQARATLVHSVSDALMQSFGFIFQYKKFFAASLGIIVVILILIVSFLAVTKDSANYTIELGSGSGLVEYNSEEVSYIRNVPEGLAALKLTDNKYSIFVVNVSSKAGAAGELGAALTQMSFPVTQISTDLDRVAEKTVIIFPQALQNEALTISDALGGVSVSATEEAGETIKIYVGKDNISQ